MNTFSNIYRLKKVLIPAVVFCIFGIVTSKGQELKNPVPPSPTAASLGQYADVPVSNYTGVPGISIPLFNIKSGNIELPVTLSYHASGIRVAQEASWVGLGWALNAGGVITRQVRGIDDLAFDEHIGYLRAPLPPATGENLPDWSDPNNPLPNDDNFDEYEEIYTLIKNGYYDGEPDIFYYNFFGYSGKLVFDKQTENEITGISIDQNNLIFKYDISLKQWAVTDGNGWKFYLGSAFNNTTETTRNFSVSRDTPYSSESQVDSDIAEIEGADMPKEMITAWYLTKVVTPMGDVMEFFYENGGETISQTSYSETLKEVLERKLLAHSGNGYTTAGIPATEPRFSASRQVVNGNYLKKIKFKNGFLVFTPEGRDDIRPSSAINPKPVRLKSIELQDLTERSIKKVDFNYSYFNEGSSADKLRLRLDGIQESNGTERIPPYVFSYNSTALPKKTSYSVDYWGYYNGQSNENTIAYSWLGEVSSESEWIIEEESTNFYNLRMLSPFFKNIEGEQLYLEGANREVNKDKIQAAVLNKIQYPTGGSVDFIYEPNDYYYEENVLYDYDDKTTVYVTDSGDDEFHSGSEKEFTLDKYMAVNLSFNIEGDANEVLNFSTAALQDESGANIISIYNDVSFNENGTFDYRATVLLAPGTYKLKAQVAEPDYSNITISVSVNYINSSTTNKKYGAGLRIKSIITKDNGLFVKRREFNYENEGISTGQLISPSHFFFTYELLNKVFNIRVGNVVSETWYAQYLVRSSGTLSPLGNSAQGSVIGYDEVVVSDVDEDNNSLGSSKYYYKNIEEFPAEYYLPGTPNVINLSNGQLLAEVHLNQAGETVREKTIEYFQENSINRVKGVKIFDYFGTPGVNEIRFYDVYSEWWHPESSIETTYDVNGENPLTTTTFYKYDNPSHKNLTETKSKNSKGEWVITTNTYPSDLTESLDEMDYVNIIEPMVNVDNIVNPIIKFETTVDGVVVNGILNNYSREIHTDENNETNNMYLLKNVKTIKKGTSSDYIERLEYIKYDNNGRLLQAQKPNGMPISYIWGYNNEYPIARIENATYDEVESYIANIQAKSNLDDDHCLDNTSCNEKELRIILNALRVALPDAFITTYTYDPLVGITSQTDPNGKITYFEYDDFSRMQNVKDFNGDITQHINYHYRIIEIEE